MAVNGANQLMGLNMRKPKGLKMQSMGLKDTLTKTSINKKLRNRKNCEVFRISSYHI